MVAEMVAEMMQLPKPLRQLSTDDTFDVKIQLHVKFAPIPGADTCTSPFACRANLIFRAQNQSDTGYSALSFRGLRGTLGRDRELQLLLIPKRTGAVVGRKHPAKYRCTKLGRLARGVSPPSALVNTCVRC